jgi:HEAT repeat protein
MRRHLALASVAALIGAALLTAAPWGSSDPSPDRAGVADRGEASSPAALAPGAWWRGALSLDQEITLPGGAPALQLGLRATAQVTEAEDADGEQRRVWQLTDARVDGLQGQAAPVDATQAELTRPFGAAYDARGRLIALYVPAGGDPLGAGLREQLVSLAQLDLGPAADAWTSEEIDPVGAAEVRYAREGARVRRDRAGYLRVVAGDAREVEGEAHAEARVGGDGRLDALDVTDTLRRSLGTADLRAAVELRLSLRRQAQGAGPAPAWDPSWVRVTPGLGIQHEAAKADLEQQVLAGATLSDLFARLGGTEGIDRARLARQVTAYLRLHPEALAEVRARLPDVPARDADVLLQAMAGSGVPGAPAAVADALAADARPEVRAAAARELALAATPDPAAIGGLERGLTDADPLVREASQLGLGALVRAGADPSLVARFAEGFDPAAPDARARLAALGNSGVPETLDVAMSALTAADAEVRATALTALRHVEAPVDDALWIGFADADAQVRLAAVRAADAAGGAASEGLVDLATKDGASAVRAAALRALADHRSDADVQAAARAAAQDGDPGVRAAAAALLTP